MTRERTLSREEASIRLACSLFMRPSRRNDCLGLHGPDQIPAIQI